MEKEQWNSLCQRLLQQLRLNAMPVGVSYFTSMDQLKAVEKVRLPDKRYSPCMVIGQAARFGWTAACLAGSVHADYCRAIHGMAQRDEKFYSGGMFDDYYFQDLADSKRHQSSLTCLPAQYVGLVASPLERGRLVHPDVCIVYATPAQAFMLLIGWQFFGHEKLLFSFVGESTCSDSWVSTILTGKPKVSIPCYAERKFGAVREDELVVSMTPEDLVRAVDGVEELFKRGFRYPIAPYGLSNDMLAGLPERYLSY